MPGAGRPEVVQQPPLLVEKSARLQTVHPGAGSWGAFVALVMPHIGRWFDARDFAAACWFAALCPVLGYAL